MKGVILAGGTGSRLYPLTRITNKHLLPVYDQPMVVHSLNLFKKLEIIDVMLVVGGFYCGEFLRLFGSGRSYGLNRLQYTYQEEANGIAGALSLARDFIGADQKLIVLLGDNVFEHIPVQAFKDFSCQPNGARLILAHINETEHLQHLGVANIVSNKLVSIIEKPLVPPTNWVVTGLYMYDSSVFDIIDSVTPSARGELEITDINNHYINMESMSHSYLDGFWGDLGESIDSYYYVCNQIREKGINK